MLTTLVKKYSGNFFTSADWQSIQAAEATALAGIDNAASTGEAYRAQQTAQKTITAIQEAAVEANTDNLYYFHNLLNMLPDDTAKIDKSAEGKIENLISRYGSMTEYQLQQLTPLEIQKYKEIETVYTDGLPDARDYALFVETVIEDGSDEDDRALTDMVQWLETHTASDDIYEEESQSLAALDSFHTVTYNFSKRGYVLTPVIAAPAYTSNVSVCVNPDYAAYFHVRNQDLPTGVNWSISDENVTISSNSTIATLKGRMTYTVNGTAYEIKDINVDGVDESSLASITLPFLDTSTYKDKTQAAIKLSIPESFLQFTMPYSDVKVTVTWGPAAGTAGEISAAQDAARSAIESAYAGYRKSDYSVENWAVLTRAKTDGLAAVEAAVSVKAVKTERQAALAAMAAVKKNSTDAGTEVDLPDYGKTVGQVYITVENNTFSDGAFTGKIIDGQYDLCAEDTMMTAVLKALKAKGYSWTGTGGTGYDITYLASIYIDANSNGKYDDGEKKLGEFDGEPGSGWMGTLNDWFVNAGFNEFSAENTGNDALENGDVIDVVYTQDLGADVGGTWGNSDTGLSALKVDGGTLSPDFDSDTLNYCLITSGNKANVFVTPTATNKNYLVKTFLNTYNSDGALYKRTETIPVKSGDVIYVGCGEYSWPSMNNQSEDAISYTGTQYTVKVYSSGKDGVQAQIDALPDAGKITRSNYKTYQNTVVQVRKAYDALSDKTGVTVAKLTAAESKIKFFSEIDAVKSKLSALLDSDRATDAQIKAARRAIEAADTAYKALSQEQQDYITVGDVTNYNKLVARLSKLTTTSAGSISGSTTVPTEKETDTTVLKPDVTVSGATVFARIGKSDLAEAVAAANTAGSGSITISAETDRTVTASEVTLNAKGVQGVGTDSKADIIISTPDGALTLPNNTLSMLASSGSDIVVAMMEKNVSDLKLTDVDTRNALAAEITITVGGKAVTTFEGESLNIDLPVNGNYTKGADYNVMVISADGSREIVTGKCIEKDGGLYVKIATTHLSIFVVTNGKAMNFTDIKAGAWYYDAVKYAYDNGLFEGTSDTTFSPDVPMTRAMLATVLYRMGGTPAVTGTSIFTDVADGEFYTDAVVWATENNIVKGTSNTTFDPNASVTREQMAVILYRYATYRKYDTAKTADISTFTDASSVSGYAMGAMQWANAEGLISGTTAAALVPNGTATRAQAATILMRLAESAEK
ncbi:MAG: S-layer homology domain-containing protein [Intestinimonas sp.]|nr:S-layer homology domain-containing protein [Intestinimonas sp.]